MQPLSSKIPGIFGLKSRLIISKRGKLEKDISFFKRALAAAMVRPIRDRLDYHSLARKIIIIDELPQGALPIYNKSEDDDI